MKIYRKNSCFGLVIGVCCCITMAYGMSQEQASVRHGLLIFLDDGNDKDVADEFIAAVIQEAGPILVSASLFYSVKDEAIPDEKGYRDFLRFDSTRMTKELKEQWLKNFFGGMQPVAKRITQLWIVKEVNPSLYLLLPKKYLQAKNISVEEVSVFLPQRLTTAEFQLGLKVSHMRRVFYTSAMRRSRPKKGFAGYFVDALPSLFVTNHDYFLAHKRVIPQWGVYILGHATMYESMCDLSIDQFRRFVDFLEKITTRLLVYTSCYTGGLHAERLYSDLSTGIQRTYSFPIIMSALSDTPVASRVKVLPFGKKEIALSLNNYQGFVESMIMPGDVKYEEVMNNFYFLNLTIPQIKYPGLPWFSVLDRGQVVSIGSVMAKTRTKPLSLATFFAPKRGESFNPRVVLLYDNNVPFELVVDTKKDGLFYAPTFVSMIPGYAVHSLKKITARDATLESIINAFFVGQIPEKYYLVDEVTARLSKEMQELLGVQQSVVTIHNLAIGSRQKENGNNFFGAYFVYNGTVYWVEGLSGPDNPIQQGREEKYDIIVRSVQERAAGLKLLFNESAVENRPLKEWLTPEGVDRIKEVIENRAVQVRLNKEGL